MELQGALQVAAGRQSEAAASYEEALTTFKMLGREADAMTSLRRGLHQAEDGQR